MGTGSQFNSSLFRFACLTALATLALVSIGGLVTSHEAGMAVPDWPNSYGYNMFLFPISKWVGGIFYEHSHRLVATIVGTLVVALTRWLGGRASQLPLSLIGAAELVAGFALLSVAPKLQGAGHFLSGIGVVVLLAGAVWVRNEPAPKPLPALGWLAFVLVQIQGLLGGLRVVLYKNEIGIFHATLAQLFFVLLCAICLLAGPWWQANNGRFSTTPHHGPRWLAALVTAVSVLILGQLILGATMRHQHAGLAIPDFPLAYGKLWPVTDRASVQLYNQHRLETVGTNAITGAQILLQMVHRLVAICSLLGVGLCAWGASRTFGHRAPLSKLAWGWFGLICLQALLGAATIWSNKAADIATAHVVVGALSLAFGGIMSIVCIRNLTLASGNVLPASRTVAESSGFGAPSPATGIHS